MTVVEIAWKPPEGGKWRVIHWTLLSKLEAVLAELQPKIVYRDKSGSYWIPVEEKG